MDLLKSLHWRYATKLFDTSKIVSDEDVSTLMEVMRMAPTSLGLQPLRIKVVSDLETKKALDDVCLLDQHQPSTASHVFVFACPTDVTEPYYKSYVARASAERNLTPQTARAFKEKVYGYIAAKSESEKPAWVEKQAYLVLGQLLLAASLLEIDACPMEGFDRQKADALLDLKRQYLRSVLLCPIGYRAKNDAFQNVKKVRLPTEKFFVK